MRNNVIRFWNPTVLVVCVLAWFGLHHFIYFERHTYAETEAEAVAEFKRHQEQLKDPEFARREERLRRLREIAQLVYPALIAVVAYVLMRGGPNERRKWLASLPFVPVALLMVPALLGGGGWVFELFMIISIAWLASYFAAIGLCAAVNTGIRQWRSRHSG